MSVKKTFRWIIFIIFALLVVLLAVRAIWNAGAGASLTRYLKKAAADGLPLKFADLGPPCPAGESAAPLWKAADALLDLDAVRAANLGGSPFGEWLNGARQARRSARHTKPRSPRTAGPIDLYLESSGPDLRPRSRAEIG